MATTPLQTIAWLDPYEQTDFQVGASVTWHVAFMDRISKIPADPDSLNLSYTPPLSSTAVPVTPVKDAVGVYHEDVQLTSVGRWLLAAAPTGSPGSVATGSVTMSVQVYDPQS